MRKTSLTLAVFALTTLAQSAGPTPADLEPLTAAVRDYFRAEAQYGAAVAACGPCQAAKQQRDAAAGRATTLKATLERQFGGTVDLETSLWIAKPGPKENR